MNILIIVKNMEHQNGGVCTHLLALVKEYKKLKHKVFLIADGSDYDDSINGLKINYIKNIGLKNINKDPFELLRAYLKIKKICEVSNIDIIHLHTQSAIPIAAIIRKNVGIPYIWTNHINDIPQPQILSLFHKLFRFPVISVSENLKDDLVERLRFDEKLIRIIPNGIDLESFKTLTNEEKKNLKIKFNVHDRDYNICILSRVSYNKGHDLLVRAIKKVQDKHRKLTIHLIIAGDIEDVDWYDKEVLEFIKSNNLKMDYVGFQNPRDIFGISDLFVLPSRKEGFGLVCAEAFAMRCPVIRSNSPGWTEMQEYCQVVSIDNINELADAIDYTILNRNDVMEKIEKGYIAVKNIYNSEIMANRTIEYYKAIIEKRGLN